MDTAHEYIPPKTFATCLEHQPQPCVDLIVDIDGGILLTRRRNKPAKGRWFWPGGRIYKGETHSAAARRIAGDELGLTDIGIKQSGVSEHFWAETAAEGVASRHTIPIIYKVTPRPGESVTLDDQHDAKRIVQSKPEDVHEYVSEYFDRFELP
jgi:colanic acid biosynthesis protein WcaH